MRTKTGTATSTKMAKTVIIMVHIYKTHPKYKKKYRSTKKFYAHDENESCKEGDTVTIRECRPISKLKRWQVLEVNGKSLESPLIRGDVPQPELPQRQSEQRGQEATFHESTVKPVESPTPSAEPEEERTAEEEPASLS